MKKILTILGMITCMIGLTACGSAQEDESASDPRIENAKDFGIQTVELLDAVVSENAIEDWAAYYMDLSGGYDPGYTVLYNGFYNYKSALEDIGNYNGTDGATVKVDGEEFIVSVNILGSKHNAVADIVLILTADGLDVHDWVSVSTNVTYSFAEKMENAALNTILGMGTVFVILILISLIISAFALIPKLVDSKKKPEAAKEVKVDKVVAQIVEKEELNDDLELVAVISAAIAAYEGSGSTDGFVVRSIRKARR